MPDLSDMPMALRIAYLAMHRETTVRLTQLEITADQFVCLVILSQAGDGMIQRELVERASSDPNTISAILALLERKDYVVRKADSEDRRARIVALTAKGRQIVKRAIKSLAIVHTGIRAALTDDEIRTLVALLKKLSGHLA